MCVSVKATSVPSHTVTSFLIQHGEREFPSLTVFMVLSGHETAVSLAAALGIQVCWAGRAGYLL